MQSHLLSLIIFAPLLGAAINWLIGRRVRNERFIGLVACGSVGISTIIAFYLAFKSDGALRSMQPIMDHLWTWVQVGSFRADFGLAMDRLSGIYVLFVTFVGLLIHASSSFNASVQKDKAAISSALQCLSSCVSCVSGRTGHNPFGRGIGSLEFPGHPPFVQYKNTV